MIIFQHICNTHIAPNTMIEIFAPPNSANSAFGAMELLFIYIVIEKFTCQTRVLKNLLNYYQFQKVQRKTTFPKIIPQALHSVCTYCFVAQKAHWISITSLRFNG